MSRLKPMLLLSFLAPMGLQAHEVHATPQQTVALFHEALASGDTESVLELLDPEVVIFESGGAELSRNEYASHHLEADMAFSAATTQTIIEQQGDHAGDTAWVLTRSKTQGKFRDKEIDSLGTETVVLWRGEHGWRIVHIHWSSRPRPKSP
jgi:ketosteroid isomerase-like protein